MQTSVDKTTSRKLANAGLLCSAMVVALHTCGRIMDPRTEWELWLFQQFVPHGLCLIAVPFFFSCAGFLLAGHCEERGWYIRECKKRLRSLLIPYLLFSLLFAGFRDGWLHTLVSNTIHVRPPWMDIPSAMGYWVYAFGLHPFRYPPLVPLWFVRALLVLVAVSPILWYCIRKWPTITLWTAWILWLLWCFLPTESRSFHLFMSSVPFYGLWSFVFGMSLRLRGSPPFEDSKWHVPLLLGMLGLSLFVLLSAMKGHHVYWGRPFFIPPLLLSFWILTPDCSFPRWLLRSSFPVYILHPFVWLFVSRFATFYVNSPFTFALKWTIGFSVPIAISVVLRKQTPRAFSLAFGGR